MPKRPGWNQSKPRREHIDESSDKEEDEFDAFAQGLGTSKGQNGMPVRMLTHERPGALGRSAATTSPWRSLTSKAGFQHVLMLEDGETPTQRLPTVVRALRIAMMSAIGLIVGILVGTTIANAIVKSSQASQTINRPSALVTQGAKRPSQPKHGVGDEASEKTLEEGTGTIAV